MRFVGKVAIILIVVLGAAVAHSMRVPIARDLADAMQRNAAKRATQGGLPSQDSSAGASVPDPAPSGTSQAQSPPENPVEAGGQYAAPGVAPSPAPAPAAADDPDPDLPDYYISVARAYELWDQGMPFLDARTDAEREVGTVEGAFHLETRHFITGMSDQVLAQIEPAFPVIVFCAGGECDASENVAQRLIGRGFTEVYIMHEGFGAWEAAGHPTEPVGDG
jgi:rhodanese-related sulfurtransferase